MLAWCEARDVHFGVGLAEGNYFLDVANDMATNLLEYPFGEISNYDEILNEHSSKFRRRGDGIHGFKKVTTPFLKENKAFLLMAYKSYLANIEDSIVYKEYNEERVWTAEKLGLSNIAAHAQLTRTFQDAITAFSNQKTLNEIIKRASDGKTRLAKMMKRDLGFDKATLMSEVNGIKNLKLFYRCLSSVL